MEVLCLKKGTGEHCSLLSPLIFKYPRSALQPSSQSEPDEGLGPQWRKEHLIRTSEFQLQSRLYFAAWSTPLSAPEKKGFELDPFFFLIPSFTEYFCDLCYRWVPPGVLFTPVFGIKKKFSSLFFNLNIHLSLELAVLSAKSKVSCLLMAFLC